MELDTQSRDNFKRLFTKLYFAQTEQEVDTIINNYPDIFKPENWSPLGGSENNFGVIETNNPHQLQH